MTQAQRASHLARWAGLFSFLRRRALDRAHEKKKEEKEGEKIPRAIQLVFILAQASSACGLRFEKYADIGGEERRFSVMLLASDFKSDFS